MGIFGFLSKAHIEQTAAGTDNLARVETIQSEIDRNLGIIGRAENRIRELENSETGADANIQSQIDREQERIDNAYVRIQPAIDEQNKIIADVSALFQQELDRIDTELATLQGYIDAGDIRKAQGMVGTATDGAYGPKTAAAFTAWQDAKRAERNEWLQKIQQAANSPTVKAARDEIARLRKSAEDQIAQSNTLINRLRTQIGGTQNADDVQKNIDEQNERIKTASNEVDRLTDEKIQLESEYRKLEAEVGPIKYIAEFIYGEQADKNMLEEAVRWVIIVIIFVFDPLAVLLLIASQYTFEFNRRKDDNGGWLRQWREYEQARAQRIVDNPGFTPSTSVPESDPHPPGWMFTSEEKPSEDDRPEDREETEQVDTSLPEAQSSETVEAQDEADTVVVTEEEKQDIAREYSSKIPEEENSIQKKNIESSEELVQTRAAEFAKKEQDVSWQDAKRSWKDDHPDQTLKEYKEKYISGIIDELPWEDYLDSKKKTYIMKQGNTQVRKKIE